MNSICIMGNLTRDPKLRRLPSGVAVVDVGVAVTTRFRNKSGEKLEETAFLDCEAWDSGAETIDGYFKKGDPIIIEGRIKTDSWTTKDTNEKRSKNKIRINKFYFIPGYNYEQKEKGEEVEIDEEAVASNA